MKKYKIFVVSDSTAETAWRAARSALTQFSGVDCEIVRVPDIGEIAEVRALVKKISSQRNLESLIIYTFADLKMRKHMAELLTTEQLQGVDLTGPVISTLESMFARKSRQLPGVQYRNDEGYDARMKAVEFTVKHDDGLGMATIKDADVILLGPSRTGKTPLSMYLALKGYRVANVPLFTAQPLPAALLKLPKANVIGLFLDAKALLKFRHERIRQTGADEKSSGYANIDVIKEEIRVAMDIYDAHNWPSVDVTGKAIEEVAVEVVALLEPENVPLGVRNG